MGRTKSESKTLITGNAGTLNVFCLGLFYFLFDFKDLGARGYSEKLFWSGSATKGVGNPQTNGFSVGALHSVSLAHIRPMKMTSEIVLTKISARRLK